MTQDHGAAWQSCPFDGRLARTPYLVLPKLAIQVMPFEWRVRFDAMLEEMEQAGLATPTYEVVREGGEIRQKRCRDKDDWRCGEIVPVVSIDDPWADYRHDQLRKVRELCPAFPSPPPSATRHGTMTPQSSETVPVTQLLPCPFCGKSNGFVERTDFSSCHVACNDCGARGPSSCDENDADAEASENGDVEPGELPARRLWNTRLASTSTQDARVLREALERIADCKIIATRHPDHGPVICWDFDVNEAAREALRLTQSTPEAALEDYRQRAWAQIRAGTSQENIALDRDLPESEAAPAIPAECDPNCADPDCPYTHTPRTTSPETPGAEVERISERVKARRRGLLPGEPIEGATVTIALTDAEALTAALSPSPMVEQAEVEGAWKQHTAMGPREVRG